MTFHDLFRQPTRRDAGVLPPDRRSELFPAVVAAARNVRLWHPGDPFAAHGFRLVVGAAMWSGYDLNLLDLIESTEAAPPTDVFDIDAVGPAGVGRYIPGAGKFWQTPFAGLWEHGAFVESAAGADARRLVARACRLDPAAVEGVMDTVRTRK